MARLCEPAVFAEVGERVDSRPLEWNEKINKEFYRKTSSASLITKRPGICGGDACIDGHRIPVWVLIDYRRLGTGDADILIAYPSP